MRRSLPTKCPIVVARCLLWAAVASGQAASGIVVEEKPFGGVKAGDERDIEGIKFCWCPAGKFTMGSPPNEPERRPGEDQVVVTLSKGFWIGKFEVTQGQWKRVVGSFPGDAPRAREMIFRSIRSTSQRPKVFVAN